MLLDFCITRPTTDLTHSTFVLLLKAELTTILKCNSEMHLSSYVLPIQYVLRHDIWVLQQLNISSRVESELFTIIYIHDEANFVLLLFADIRLLLYLYTWARIGIHLLSHIQLIKTVAQKKVLAIFIFVWLQTRVLNWQNLYLGRTQISK